MDKQKQTTSNVLTMRTIFLITFLFIGLSGFPQKLIAETDLIGMYKFDLTSSKDYLIKILDDGSLTGQEVPRGINVNYSNYKSALDKGSWKIISGTQFQIFWSDIPKWTCTVVRNDKNKIIGFIEDSKTFVERISIDQ